MKRSLLLISWSILFIHARSQGLQVRELVPFLESPQKKLESYLAKNDFLISESKWGHDTLINVYTWKPPKKKAGKEESVRKIELYNVKGNFSFNFLTSSKNDFTISLSSLKMEGFFCGENKSCPPMLFQKRNISVEANMFLQQPGDTLYSFWFNSVNLPSAKNIRYADDLLLFNSHQELAAVFGEKNVIKDVYYFSDSITATCSVLFPKTNRQAVFIWADEENLRQPDYILVGSNVKTKTTENFDGWVEENMWSSQQGVYPGMTLGNLIRLNGSDFKFFGVNSRSPFWVMPENTGALDFKKIKVVLGCLNGSSSKLLKNETISAGEIIDDNTGLYVFMLVLSPPSPMAKR